MMPCEKWWGPAGSKISRELRWLLTAQWVRCFVPSLEMLALLLRPLVFPLQFASTLNMPAGMSVRRHEMLRIKRNWRTVCLHRQWSRSSSTPLPSIASSPSSSTVLSRFPSLTGLSTCNAATLIVLMSMPPKPGNVNGRVDAFSAPFCWAGDGGAHLCTGDSCGNLNDVITTTMSSPSRRWDPSGCSVDASCGLVGLILVLHLRWHEVTAKNVGKGLRGGRGQPGYVRWWRERECTGSKYCVLLIRS
ncbi:hypothetical protein EDB87DRAFT_201673 [Lactarius vividus]|nr:hypothetical protein EDB87DRAFT_201673 [Lactarius vividus]